MVFSSSTRLRFALALGQNFERNELRQLKERCFIFFRRDSTVVLNVGGGTIFTIADEDLSSPLRCGLVMLHHMTSGVGPFRIPLRGVTSKAQRKEWLANWDLDRVLICGPIASGHFI